MPERSKNYTLQTDRITEDIIPRAITNQVAIPHASRTAIALADLHLRRTDDTPHIYIATSSVDPIRPTVLIITENEGGRLSLWNIIVTGTSASLFFTGWWIAIDASIIYKQYIKRPICYHLAGTFGTVAFILVNSISDDAFYGKSNIYRRLGLNLNCLRLLFSIALVMAFAAVIYSLYIMLTHSILKKTTFMWPGIALFVQNILIFIANMLYRFYINRET